MSHHCGSAVISATAKAASLLFTVSRDTGHALLCGTAATEGHVWVCGRAAAGVGVNNLWLILPLESIRTFLVWTGTWDHIVVQGLCRTDPTSHWLQHSGEPASPLTDSSTQESSPAPLLDSTVELALVEGEWVSQPKGR